MKKGFSIVEILVSLVLFSFLSTSIFFFLEGYTRTRYLEKRRFEGFRMASALMEKEIDQPPLCLEGAENLEWNPWGWVEVRRHVFGESTSLLLVKIQVHQKKDSSIVSVLRRVVKCR